MLPTNPVLQRGDGDAVEILLRNEMQKRRIPGLQLAVVQQGVIVKLAAYGLANVEHRVAATNQTVFPTNSITKAFTGVAIMQLVEAGALDLDAPVSCYLDCLPIPWQIVTARQLLTHTSGIPGIMDGNAKMVADGDDAAWQKVQTMPLEFAPGEAFSYNQTGYLLLGWIIEKLSGQAFTQFITERQFNAVGMPCTGFSDSRDVVSNRSQSYCYLRDNGGELAPADTLNNLFEEFPPFLRTAAGIHSTAEEMARWIIALQQGQLLRSGSLTTLWTPGVLNDGSAFGFSDLLNGYALGWLTMTRAAHRAVGGVGGGRSAFFIYPDDDLAVVILTNLQGSSPESFIDEVVNHYTSTTI